MIDATARACGSLVLVASLAATSLAACTITTTTSDGPGTTAGRGQLALTWTVAGTAGCAAHRAAFLHYQVTDASGTIHDGEVNCPLLSATLPQSFVSGTATVVVDLRDENRRVLTTPAQLSVYVGIAATAPANFDFPISSFLTTPAATTTVSWNVEGSQQAAACAAHNAANISFWLVGQSDGVLYGPFFAACSAFTTSVNASFPAGQYRVRAALYSASPSAALVSSTLDSELFVIPAGGGGSATLGFPKSAFDLSTATPANGYELDWTVGGSVDASLCVAGGLANLVVNVADGTTGAVVGGPYVAACSSFQLRLPALAAGSYVVSGQFFSAGGVAVGMPASVPLVVSTSGAGRLVLAF